MIKIDSFISLTQMSQGSPDFIHKKVISRIQRKSSIEHINSNIVLSFNEEKDSHRIVYIRVIKTFSYSLLKYMNKILVHLLYMFHFKSYLVLNIFRNDVWIKLNVFILWIEEEPLLKVMHGFNFIESVST